MKRKIVSIFVCMLLIATTMVFVPKEINVKADPSGGEEQIGYELIDNNTVLHIWNKYNSYYFNTSSGIQLTNHYNEYWSHNVLMLGYYNNDEWNLIYRTDELTGFNKDIDTDNETFVNATIWKDLTYNGYDFRLAIRYHLGVDDNELTVIPYIKNIDEDNIPYVLGFGWEMKDIQIDMSYSGDYIDVNRTIYYLNQTLNNTYTNLSEPIYCWNESANQSQICEYTDPAFYLKENITDTSTKSLYLRWNKDLNYAMRVKSRTGQYNAPVSLFIRIGTLDSGQEKYTSMYWYDADQKTYYFSSYDEEEAWATYPDYMVDGSTSNFANEKEEGVVELCDANGLSVGQEPQGTIMKVELRAYGCIGSGGGGIELRPVFSGEYDGDDHYFEMPIEEAAWSSYFDITSDTNAPSSWSWSDIGNLDCDVETVDGEDFFCSKVEIRMTYDLHIGEAVYYFNDEFESDWEYPDYMVDGDYESFAYVEIDGIEQYCSLNTCEGEDLGDISKVEIRACGYYENQGTTADISLTPVYGGKTYGSEYIFDAPEGEPAAWSEWFDITNNGNVSLKWTWKNVQDLDCDVEAVGNESEGFVLYCSKVDIRVTYIDNDAPVISNPYPSNGSTGISVSPELRVTVDDEDGDTLTAYWYSNSSGSWILFATNSSVNTSSGSVTIRQTNSNFSNYSTTYYWSVRLTDGTDWTNKTYYFTTGTFSTSVDAISPYIQSSSPLTITASGPSDFDNVTLWYRYSTDNSSWGGENWWDSSWTKRTPVNLSVSSGETEENHAVLLNVGYDVDMNNDFSDLRFVRYADNTTLLDYWIESQSNGNWCNVWVEFRDNITTTDQPFAWIYYGNPGAGSLSNGFDTFLFFDDFSGSSLNSTRWPTQSGSITVSDGTVHLDFPDTSYAYAQSNSQSYIGVLEFRSKYTYDSNIARFGSFIKTHYGGTYGGRGIHIWDSGAYILNPDDPGVYHKYKIVKTSTDALWYFDGNYKFTRSKSGDIGTLTLGNNGEAYRAGDVWFDYIFTRKYTASEPTYSIGGEQGSGSDWIVWSNSSNPDTNSPWSWEFDFPNGVGYYEFYSIGKKSGQADESAPDSADARCHYVHKIVMNYNFSFSEPEITELIVNGTVYHRVNMDSLPIDGDVGVPLLPVKPLNILLPQAYVLDSITVTWEGNISLGEGFNVELGTEPAIPGQNHTSNESINFNQTMPYPVELFLNVGTYDFRGYNILTFILHPIHYIGETGELYYYDEMNVTVKTINTGEVSPFFRAIQEDEMMIEADEDILDIYNMTLTYANFSENISCSSIVDPSESYDYVIITSNDLKNAQGNYTFQTLRDFKNNRGTSTKIVTVEEIESCSDYYWNGAWGDGFPFFNDTQCHIRNFIKDAYSNWNTNYILLGGDNITIPARYFYIPWAWGLDPIFIPSDLYYAALDRNFNLDRDEHWGEITDIPDLRAEVFVGRACVETDDEVSNFVGKTLSYINTNNTDSYIEDVLMAGEELDSFTFGGDLLDELIDISTAGGFLTSGIPSDEYDIHKLYDRDWPDWPTSEIIDYINSNIHFINHAGHSDYSYNMKMDNSDVGVLVNDKYCFIYSIGCLSGGFDQEDCIAEHFTVKTSHGAFAGIWNTRSGLYRPDKSSGLSSNFQRQFWDAIYRESQRYSVKKEIGAANQDSKEDNIWRLRISPFPLMLGLGYRWCYYEITLFGDPQVIIKTPAEPTPSWILPDGYNDSDDAWDYEILAYDNDIGTKAGCTITDSYWNEWVWTPWLELTLSTPITCDKIRFYAWYNFLHCNEIEYYIYGDNSTHHRSGYFDNHEWVVDDIPGGPRTNIYKAKVRFHVRRGIWSQVTADLHEFQFHEYS